MSDALASNTMANESLLIRCHCLAHGRRKCSDVAEVFPHACQVVLEVIRQGCEHDAQARQEQLRPADRLPSHQRLSGPLMEGLHIWLSKQVDDGLVEPKSSLGKAIAYLQGPWNTLTPFLQHEGAPRDHNLAERALQLLIRQRNHALFFATEPSASIASVLTSLIAPASLRESTRWSTWSPCKNTGLRSVPIRRRGCPGPMPVAGRRLRPPVANPWPCGPPPAHHSTAQ
jgi:hypothetical protein